MSNRNQTKSLDRDIQSRPKKNSSFPVNIQQVNNAAELSICNFQNKIETIFETYPVGRFELELDKENLSNYIDNISNKINVDSVKLTNLSQLIKVKYASETISDDPDDLISIYLDFILNCYNLFHGMSKKLFHTILNGLLRYCISFASFCSLDVEFVINYEKMIRKNESDIVKEIKDIEFQNKEFKQITSSTQNILNHSLDLISMVRKIRASINQLYYLVTEWVDEERNYPAKLSNEINSLKSELFTIEQRSISNNHSIKVKQMKIAVLEKQLKTLEKNNRVLKRKFNRVQHSQYQIITRLKELETQAACQTDDINTLKNKIKLLEHIKLKPGKRVKIPHYKVSMEIKSTQTEKRNFEAKSFRLQDNKQALDRHKERLSKIAGKLEENMDKIKSQIVDNQSEVAKLKEGLQKNIDIQQNDVGNLKKFQIKLKDITFIYVKKNSPDTMRQLQNHGRLITQSKDANLTDKLCDIVSKKILDNWKELYMHLPMYPERTIEQRYRDIDIIDTISARIDGTPEKQAKMCLDKWRLFYHNAKPEHLIEGLQKSDNRDIANELKYETCKERGKYEEKTTREDESHVN